MTPDGLSTEDWDRVHETALEIVHASSMDDEILCSHHTEHMFEILDELETRYGRIPSVLATRADYIDDPLMAIALHEEVLLIATDPLSRRFSLQSLIRLMIDLCYEGSSIQVLLDELERVTDLDAESFDADEFRELQEDFKQLKEKCLHV